MSADVLAACLTALAVALLAWDHGRRALANSADRKALEAARDMVSELRAELREEVRDLSSEIGAVDRDSEKAVSDLIPRLEELEGEAKKRGEQVDKLRFSMGERAQQVTSLSHRQRGARGQAPG